jgi:hypothetical protein
VTRSRAQTSIALAITLASTSVPFRATAAEPASPPAPGPTQPANPTPHLDESGANVPHVDVSGLGEFAVELAPQIVTAAGVIATEHGFEPRSIAVRISWLDADSFQYAIRVSLKAERREQLLQAPITATCRGCTESALVEAAVQAVEAEIVAARAPVTAEPAVKAITPSIPSERRGARRLEGIGIAGITILSVGSAGLVGGIVLAAVGERQLDDPQDVEGMQVAGRDVIPRRQDLRPLGFALLGTSFVLVATGAVLLGVDRARARRAVDVALVANPQSAALSLSGRF